MSKVFETIMGNMGGVDIGAIVAAIGYVVKVGIEIKNWYAERKEQRIDGIILDAINWVFVNKVQPQKRESENGKLTAEQSTEANAAAVAKAVAFADKAGIAVDPETISGRVQGVFARFKAAVGNNGQPELLKGE